MFAAILGSNARPSDIHRGMHTPVLEFYAANVGQPLSANSAVMAQVLRNIREREHLKRLMQRQMLQLRALRIGTHDEGRGLSKTGRTSVGKRSAGGSAGGTKETSCWWGEA